MKRCGVLRRMSGLAVATAVVGSGSVVWAQSSAQGQGGANDGFSGSATVAASLESGRTDLTATQLAFQGRQPYSVGGALTMAVAWRHATTPQPGTDENLTVADRLNANIGIEHNFGERWVLMVRTQALRDPISGIDYRVEQITGFGIRLQGARAQARIIPGFALLNHDKNVPLENGFNTNYGVYQDLRFALTPTWNLQQYVYASRDPVDDDDYNVTFDVSLTGAITQRFGLQLSYHYAYEKLLPVGVDPEYQKLTVGLQITL